MNSTLISICIPAYKGVHTLRRLLDSIAIQTYKRFEVVVTDDSPDREVEYLCNLYQARFDLRYFKNIVQLGTPENWNEGVRRAKGEWIKIMHDDDWFVSDHSLMQFVDAIEASPGSNFIFSGYTNVSSQISKTILLPPRKRMFLNPSSQLLSENVIGPPSVTLYHNLTGLGYDRNLKWLVDIDFYIQYLKENQSYYINASLIAIGISDQQVTNTSFRVATVEIPEHFYVLSKLGHKVLRNPVIYDTFWRLFRNLNIRDIHAIREAGYNGSIPKSIDFQLRFLKFFPPPILRVGVLSKVFMSIAWLTSVYFRRDMDKVS